MCVCVCVCVRVCVCVCFMMDGILLIKFFFIISVLLAVSSLFSSDEWLWVLIFSSIAELYFLKTIQI